MTPDVSADATQAARELYERRVKRGEGANTTWETLSVPSRQRYMRKARRAAALVASARETEGGDRG